MAVNGVVSAGSTVNTVGRGFNYAYRRIGGQQRQRLCCGYPEQWRYELRRFGSFRRVPLTLPCGAHDHLHHTASSYAYGQSFQLAASSNSSGAFTYKLVSGPATVSTTGSVTVTGEGTVIVKADEAAATGYSAGSKQTSFTAVQANSATSLTATAVKSGTGYAASLTATISPQYSGAPTGTVTFYDGSTKLAMVMLSSGTATYTAGQLAGAQHSYSATYSGDTNFIGSTSNTAALTIPVTAVSLQLASTNLVYPLPPAFEIIMAAANGKPAPTDTVTLYDGSTAVATYPLLCANKGIPV